MAVAMLASAALSSSATAAEGGGGAAGRFVGISDMQATIIDGANTAGKLTVSFSIEARTPEHANDLATILPSLRAASTGALTEFATLHVSVWKPVNATQLRLSLNNALIKADPRVKAVYLTAVRAAP